MEDKSDLIEHKQILDACLSRCGLSPQGKAYFLCATDPFHDFNSQVAGMPDGTNGVSFVRNFRREISITAPTTVVSPAKWNCHIAYIPVHGRAYNVGSDQTFLDGTTNLRDKASTKYYKYETAAASAGWDTRGFLVVCKTPVTSDSFNPSYATPEYQVIVLEDLTDGSRSRLIAGGYEVHNVTEKLHMSGAVTDYCQQNHYTRGSMRNAYTQQQSSVSGNLSDVVCDGMLGSAPPSSPAEAKQINGVTRMASKGSYVTLKLAELFHPPVVPSPGPIYLFTTPN
jgi:hypothetical protein